MLMSLKELSKFNRTFKYHKVRVNLSKLSASKDIFSREIKAEHYQKNNEVTDSPNNTEKKETKGKSQNN